MRKIFYFLAIGAIALGLASCGDGNNGEEQNPASLKNFKVTISKVTLGTATVSMESTITGEDAPYYDFSIMEAEEFAKMQREDFEDLIALKFKDCEFPQFLRKAAIKDKEFADLKEGTDYIFYIYQVGEGYTLVGDVEWVAFTTKAPQKRYAKLSDNGQTMTLYYDDKPNTHPGEMSTWNGGTTDISPNMPLSMSQKEWMKKVTKVVLDGSMKDARPKSTAIWFAGLSNMTQIEHLDYLNTSEVISMYAMFWHCESLTELDLSAFNVQNVEATQFMFSDCYSLKTIYCNDDWKKSAKIEDEGYYVYMYGGCSSLVGGKGTTKPKDYDALDYSHPDGGPSNPGFFTAK